MFEIKRRDGEPIERTLKRLKDAIDRDGMMDEVRRLRAFETPAQRKKRKLKAQHKRAKIQKQKRF